MQVLITGLAASFVLWTVIVYLCVLGALRLYRDKVFAEKWLLIVPYLLASLVFYGLRYRLLLYVTDREAINHFFSIGSYWAADRFVLILCLPILYVISVLKPDWVVRTWVNLPLLVFLPFLLRLALHFSGLAPWAAHSSIVVPSRLE